MGKKKGGNTTHTHTEYRPNEAPADLFPGFYEAYQAALTASPASSGMLTLCPAPIGNLGDMTFRSYKALTQATVIACPDLTAGNTVLSLLSRYQQATDTNPKANDEYSLYFPSSVDINTASKLEKLHEKRGRGVLIPLETDVEGKVEGLVKGMKAGVRVAWISGNGTPLLGETGSALLTAAIESGVSIDSLPGPTAAMSALTSSGLPSDNFLYEGYLKGTEPEKEARLREIYSANCTAVVYVQAEEVVVTLAIIEHVFGPLHRIYVAQDLTRQTEAHQYGMCVQVVEKYRLMSHLKGDFTIVISPSGLKIQEKDGEIKVKLKDLVELISTQTTLSDSEKMEFLLQMTGLPRSRISSVLRDLKSPSSNP